MAEVIQCDRCGRVFKTEQVSVEVRKVWENGNRHTRYFDLCDKCGEDLTKFIGGLTVDEPERMDK